MSFVQLVLQLHNEYGIDQTPAVECGAAAQETSVAEAELDAMAESSLLL